MAPAMMNVRCCFSSSPWAQQRYAAPVAEAQSGFRWLKAAFPSIDPIYKGVDRGAGSFVYRPSGVLQGHRRLEDEQVVVSCVVEVDYPLFSHARAPF